MVNLMLWLCRITLNVRSVSNVELEVALLGAWNQLVMRKYLIIK